MKKIILKWLFGTDHIEDYFDLLCEHRNNMQQCLDAINDHLNTLNKRKEDLDIIRKLISVCKNHGIDVDEEIKKE